MKLEAIDKNMNIEHNGVTYKNSDGVIDVPDSVGNKFLDANRSARKEAVGKYTKSYSMGLRMTDEQWNKMFGK